VAGDGGAATRRQARERLALLHRLIRETGGSASSARERWAPGRDAGAGRRA
jgi:hypothetical protein